VEGASFLLSVGQRVDLRTWREFRAERGGVGAIWCGASRGLRALGAGPMAEREGFEPSVPLPVRLISNQVRSTKLRHLSAVGEPSISARERDALACGYSEGP
jgi:hypothetical protein